MRASSVRRRTAVMSAAISLGDGGGCCNSFVKICRTWGIVMAGVFFPNTAFLQRQEPQGQERQRHVMVPTQPTARFIVSKADLPFRFLEVFFDAMALTADADQGAQ